MDEEKAARIISESFAAVERVEQTLRNTRDFQIDDVPRAHFDPVKRRGWPQPEPEKPELKLDIPVAPANWAAYVDERVAAALAAEREYHCEVIAETLAQSFEQSERKASRRLEAELAALRAETHRLESLLEALRSATQSDRAKVIDMPSPLSRRDVN